MTDILPSSLASTVLTHKGSKIIDGVYHAPCYCMNCGKLGLWVPEEALNIPGSDFVGYLCPSCSESWGEVAGLMKVPDEVFGQHVQEAQLDEFGRELTSLEMHHELGDVNSVLARMKRDRLKLSR